MSCETGTLATDGVLDHLHHNHLPIMYLGLNTSGGLRPDFQPVGADRRYISTVQEGRTFQADVDKCRLHAGHHTDHLTQINITDMTKAAATLQINFLQQAVFDQGHASLAGGHIDEDLFAQSCAPTSTRGAPGGLCRPVAMLNSRNNAAVSYSGRPITPE